MTDKRDVAKKASKTTLAKAIKRRFSNHRRKASGTTNDPVYIGHVLPQDFADEFERYEPHCIWANLPKDNDDWRKGRWARR